MRKTVISINGKSGPVDSPEVIPNLTNLFSVRNILGFDTKVKSGEAIQSIGSSRVMYTSGNAVVIFSLITKKQTIIPPTEGALSLECVRASANGRFVAVSESTAGFGLITVYEVKNEEVKLRKHLLIKDAPQLNFTHLLFHPSDPKYLIAIADCSVFVWEWEKSKVKKFGELTGLQSVRGIFFSLNDPNVLFCYGSSDKNLCPIRAYSLDVETSDPVALKTDGIKDYIKIYTRSFKLHVSLFDGSAILVTENDELLLLNSQGEIKFKVPVEESQRVNFKSGAPLGSGFILAGNSSTMLNFEMQNREIKKPFSSTPLDILKSEDIETDIVGMTLVEGHTMAVIGALGEILQLSLQKAKQRVEFLVAKDTFSPSEIIDIAVCENKPIVAYASKDRTVRIWNYHDNTLEYISTFESVCEKITLHPSGLYLAIAFADKVRVFGLNIESLSPAFEIAIRDVSVLKFAHGGHFLAVAVNSTVQLYYFYEQVFWEEAVMRLDGDVMAVQWTQDDMKIWALWAGGVSEWRLGDEKPREIHHGYAERFSFSEKDGEIISYFPSSERTLTRWKGETKADSIPLPAANEFEECVFSNSGRYLFLGNKNGVLKVISSSGKSSWELNLGKSGISAIAPTSDDSYLLVAFRDGSLWFLELSDKDLSVRRNTEKCGYISNEVLYDEATLREQITRVEKLEYTVAIKEKELEKSKQAEIQKIEQEIASYQTQKEELMISDDQKLKQARADLSVLDEHWKQKKKVLEEDYQNKKIVIESSHKSKIEKEETETQKKRETLANIEKMFKDDIDDLTEKAEEELQEMEKIFEEKCESLTNQITNERSAKLEDDSEIKTKAAQIEQKLDQQTIALKRDFDIKEHELRTHKEAFEKQAEQARSAFILQENNLKESKNAQISIEDQWRCVEEELESLEKESANLERQLTDRDRTIASKQERIGDLVRKKQELDKFKFVLDYKIKELKREKGPREEEIAKMKQQLINMISEIEIFSKQTKQIRHNVSTSHLRIRGLKKVLDDKRAILKDFQSQFTLLQSKIVELAGQTMNPRDLRKNLNGIYHDFVLNSDKKLRGASKRALSEQRTYFESCIKSLKEKFIKNIAVHHHDNKRIMKENVDLINTINDLEREKVNRQTLMKTVEELKVENEKEIDLAMRLHEEKLKLMKLKAELAEKKRQETLDLRTTKI